MIHTITLEVAVNDADAATVVLQAMTDLGQAMASGAARYLVGADISHTMVPDPEPLVSEVTVVAPPEPPTFACAACGLASDEASLFEMELGTGAQFCRDRAACGARIEVAVAQAEQAGPVPGSFRFFMEGPAAPTLFGYPVVENPDLDTPPLVFGPLGDRPPSM